MKQNATILKVFIEINTKNKKWAFDIKNDIKSFLSIDVFPQIENYINTLDDQLNNDTLQIPKLELNIETNNYALNSELRDKICKSFQEKIANISDSLVLSTPKESPQISIINPLNQEKKIKALIYFLEKGYFPLWYNDKIGTSLLDPEEFDSLILSKTFKNKFSALSSDSNIQKTIKSQLTKEQIEKLYIFLNSHQKSQKNKESVKANLHSINHENSQIDKDSISTEIEIIEYYTIPNQDKKVKTFIYFLEYGFFPWWHRDIEENFLQNDNFDSLILSPTFEKEIISILNKPHVQKRIVCQLTNEQIAKICAIVIENVHSKIHIDLENLQLISKLNDNNQEIIWCFVLDVLSKDSVSPQNHKEHVLKQINENWLSKNKKIGDVVVKLFPEIKFDEIIEFNRNKPKENLHQITGLIKNISDENNNISDENNNTIVEQTLQPQEHYINNAGLILIHPFIRTFFEECELIHPKTNQLKDPELSAHLLHYICTGKTCAPEYNMLFEKFLCNIPIHQTIRRNVKISKKHKIQAQNIIESIQYHWKPMKNSSTELLRNEFFQRPGKLSFNENQFSLVVERKTQDILLDQLSWGMSMIKIPWKEKFIMVSW